MRTGIIADSHGLVSNLADAIAFLQRRGCHRIIHLGDICDSIRPETADACVRLIRKNRILAVKGNNDHAVAVNQTGRSDVPVLPSTVDYLNRLPLMRRSDTLLFAHSRPFVRELGLSSMIGSMSDRNVHRFFPHLPPCRSLSRTQPQPRTDLEPERFARRMPPCTRPGYRSEPENPLYRYLRRHPRRLLPDTRTRPAAFLLFVSG